MFAPSRTFLHIHITCPNSIIYLSQEDERKHWLYAAMLTLALRIWFLRFQGFRVYCFGKFINASSAQGFEHVSRDMQDQHGETSGFHMSLEDLEGNFPAPFCAKILDNVHVASLLSLRSLGQPDLAVPVFDFTHSEFPMSSHGSLQSGHRYKNWEVHGDFVVILWWFMVWIYSLILWLVWWFGMQLSKFLVPRNVLNYVDWVNSESNQRIFRGCDRDSNSCQVSRCPSTLSEGLLPKSHRR